MILHKNLKKILVNKNFSLIKVLQIIEMNGYNSVFVCNKNLNLLGIISDSDIRKLILKGKFNKNIKAKDIMTKNFFSIPRQSSFDEYQKILIRSEKVIIPILENKKLVDFIHIRDLKLSAEKKTKKRILIIGGCGYIGSILTKNLLKKGHKVNILDKNFYGNYFSKKIKKNKNLKIIIGDCFNKIDLKKALKDCKHVIHLGEIVGDPAASLNIDFSIRNNYENTNFVLSECIKNNIEKFLFASSCSVYGQSVNLCNEKSELNPLSMYAKCKIASEKALLSYKSKDFCPVILRLSTVYGDSFRTRLDLVVNRFVIMAINKIQINLFGAKSWRPFISVNDVALAFEKFLNSNPKKIKNQIFNVGGKSENYRIIDIVKIIKKYLPINYSYVKNVDDERNYRVSFKKIKNKVNFNTKDNLNKIIKKLILEYKKNKTNINNINYYNEKKIRSILIKLKKK